jgi:hypothetical protein
MKKFVITFLASAFLFIVGCVNNNSSTAQEGDDDSGPATSSGHGKSLTKPERDQTETEKMKEGSINAMKDTGKTVQH